MSRLKPHHYKLLQQIIAARELLLADVDGRMIRPLSAAGLVNVQDGRVQATRAGRSAMADRNPASPEPDKPTRLSAAQEDVLRLVSRQPGLSTDGVDQRTTRALRARGLITEADGRLYVSPEAASSLGSSRSVSPSPKRGRRPHRHPRSEAILTALEKLEHALPPGAEVLVGPIMCAAEDVADAFRKHARKLAARQNG